MSSVLGFLTNKELVRRLLFTLLIVVLFRVGSHIPVPGVDILRLNSLFDSNNVLGFFNLFSGGGVKRFSVFALGILPYINASIIFQLLVVAVPRLKELQDDGEAGRRELAQYTRYLAVFLSVIQALVMSVGFKGYILPNISLLFFISYSVVILVAGSSLVMWLGELVSEKGIGNGASLLILVGIVSQMPVYFQNTYLFISAGGGILNVLALAAIFLLLISCVVVVQQAQRRVAIGYSRKAGGRVSLSRSYLPFRLIQGGVMPVIFSSAVLQLPFLLSKLSSRFGDFVSNSYRYDSFLYNFLFCFMIFFFSYFYAAITFNPNEIAENLNKHGGFIAGLRPGSETAEFLDSVLSRLTMVGAVLLSLISVVPVVGASLTRVTTFIGLGGTAILIVVGVTMDIVKQVETLSVNRKYENGI